ncbi:cell wall-binding repeat-containing protein [Metaclostridioides mangenotii]|uniref:cell wall-binding repeat-containing protein n=1 Tax=Metaclostridioides mangenotii TaxID=1540 RepID=UPI000487CF69|nr:cell wall-binding repeat-containing protein [Clostridioides mangenotii]
MNFKYKKTLSLCTALLMLSVSAIPVNANLINNNTIVNHYLKKSKAIDEVNIPDPALREAIQHNLKINGYSEELTEENLLKITGINSWGVSTLEGVQYLKNIRTLQADDGMISDLSPLKDLTKLTILSLKNNKIKNTAGIPYHQFAQISLDNNMIEDVSGLPNSYIISLDYNRIHDPSGLYASGMMLMRFQDSYLPLIPNTDNYELMHVNGYRNYKLTAKDVLNISDSGTFDGTKFRWSGILNNDKVSYDYYYENKTEHYYIGGKVTQLFGTNQTGSVKVLYVDEHGNELAPKVTLSGIVGEPYETNELKIPGYTLLNSTNNTKGKFDDTLQEVKYVYKANPETTIQVKDSTVHVGATWKAEDNFVSATDKDGNPVGLDQINVVSSVDTAIKGTYKVTYEYDGKSADATITVVPYSSVMVDKPVIDQPYTGDTSISGTLSLFGEDDDGKVDLDYKGPVFITINGMTYNQSFDFTIIGNKFTFNLPDNIALKDNDKITNFVISANVVDPDHHGQLRMKFADEVVVKSRQTTVSGHDSTIYRGDNWKAEDNFDNAFDKNGNPVEFSQIIVEGFVDTSKVGIYTIKYSYDGAEATVTVTVKEKDGGGGGSTVDPGPNPPAPSKTVILASGEKYTDVLTATVLGNEKDAPILLSQKDKVDDKTLAEIKRLNTKNIIISGGEDSVSEKVEEQLKNYNVTRIAGQDRFETSEKIGKEVRKTGNKEGAMLVDGTNFPDVITMSILASQKRVPILLTEPQIFTNTTKDTIKSWGVNDVTIGGGYNSVSKDIENSLGVSKVTRFGGVDRYKTAELIGDEVRNVSGNKDDIILVDGTNFPDGITINSLASHFKAPIMLTEPSHLNIITKNKIKEWSIKNILIGGGYNSVSQEIEKNLGINNVERVAGQDRYETAVKISERLTQTSKALGSK